MNKFDSIVNSVLNKEVITESKQTGVLHHNTDIKIFLKILKENTLKAFSYDDARMIDFRTRRDNNIEYGLFGVPYIKDESKYPPCVCFTRQKWYSRNPDDVKIIIDGNKLSEKYKVVPYSLWGGRGKKHPTIPNMYLDEGEERVYSDIVNLNKYIIKIILPFSDLEIETLLKERNIPYEIKNARKQ